MSGISLGYSVNFNAPLATFRRLEQADTRALMTDIGETLLAAIHWRFDNEETPDGDKFTPSYRALSEGGKTLQDSGGLRDSYTYNLLSDSELEIGSNKIYSAIHHEGGTIRAKDGGKLKFKVGERWVQKESVEIPARPVLGLNDDDSAEIKSLANNFYEELINGH